MRYPIRHLLAGPAPKVRASTPDLDATMYLPIELPMYQASRKGHRQAAEAASSECLGQMRAGGRS